MAQDQIQSCRVIICREALPLACHLVGLESKPEACGSQLAPGVLPSVLASIIQKPEGSTGKASEMLYFLKRSFYVESQLSATLELNQKD